MDSRHAIGALLKAAREERELTLKQAAKALHMRANYLESLEAGRYEDLPGLPYVRGYLRAYVYYLDLDRDEIMRRFDMVEAQIGRNGFFLPQAFSKEKMPEGRIVYGALAAALVLYGLWMVVSPKRGEVSLVQSIDEVMPPPPPVSLPYVPACFMAEVSLYPPCYTQALPMTDLERLARDMADADGAASLPWLENIHDE